MKKIMIMLMFAILMLAIPVYSSETQAAISGFSHVNHFGEVSLNCQVDGTFTKEGFGWQYIEVGSTEWQNFAYTPYDHGVSRLKEMKNDNSVVSYMTTFSEIYETFENNRLNDSNIKAWRCIYLADSEKNMYGKNNDWNKFSVKLEFPMKGNDLVTTDPMVNVVQGDDLGLYCKTNFDVESYTWYEGPTLNTVVGNSNKLDSSLLKDGTTYVCEASYYDIGELKSLRGSFTTHDTKEISAINAVCNDKVVENHIQVCTVNVLDQYDMPLEDAGMVVTESGVQKGISKTNIDGNAAVQFKPVGLGEHEVTIRVAKEGYGVVEENVNFTVVKEKYIINKEDFIFSNTSDMLTSKDEFYRGDDLFVSFKVYDPATASYLTDDLDMTVKLYGAGEVSLSSEGYDSDLESFVFSTQIPLSDSFLTSEVKTFVLAIAIRDADMEDGGAEQNKSITILNNLPELEAPEYIYAAENDYILFKVNGSDKEMYTTSELTLSASSLPAEAHFDNGVFVWQPGYDEAGVYTVTFTVTDRNGGSTSKVTTIVIDNVTLNASAFISSPQDFAEFFINEEIEFEVTVNNPQDLEIEYGWDFGNGATAQGIENITYAYSEAGTYAVTLLYTYEGNTYEDHIAVVIKEGEPCFVDIVAPLDGEPFFIGDVVTFNAETDCEMDYSIEWDFANGETGNGLTTTSSYDTEGEYTIYANIITEHNTTSDNVTISVHHPSEFYDIRNIKTYNSSENVNFDVETSDFYRGDSIYVSFEIHNIVTGEMVENAPIRDVYVKKENDLAGIGNFIEYMYLDGTYYYVLNNIPLNYDVSSPDYAVAIAIDQDNGLEKEQKAINILNNLPKVEITNPVEGKTYSSNDVIGLSGVYSDVETKTDDLVAVWSVDGVVVTGTSITGLSKGSHTISLTVLDADNGMAQDSVYISVDINDTLPVAVANVQVLSQDIVAETTTIRFDASQSYDKDATDVITSYTWYIGNNVYTTDVVDVTVAALSGTISYTLRVVDDEGSEDIIQNDFTFTGPIPEKDFEYQLPIKIKQARLGRGYVYAGEYLRAYVSVYNEFELSGNEIEDLTLTVSIPRLGVSKSQDFDLDPQETEEFALYLPIASNAKGVFPVRISVGNGETERVIYKELVVY